MRRQADLAGLAQRQFDEERAAAFRASCDEWARLDALALAAFRDRIRAQCRAALELAERCHVETPRSTP